MSSAGIEQERPVLDLRILVASAIAWAVTAGSLSWALDVLAIAASGCVVITVLLVWRLYRRRPDRDRPDHGRPDRDRPDHDRPDHDRPDADRPDAGAFARGVALAVAATACALVAVAGHTAIRRAGPVPGLAARHAIVTVEGTVMSDPRVIGATHGDKDLVVTEVRIERIRGRGKVAQVTTPVVVFGDDRWLRLHWHERITFSGRLRPSDPGSDTVAMVQARGSPSRLAPAPWVFRQMESVRADFRSVTGHLPNDTRGLVPALVIGDTSRLPGDLDDDMRATGMTHLNAVSGSNVSFVAAAAIWACGWLRVPRRGRAPAVLVTLSVFVLLCRPEPSVIRAAVMGVVGLIGLTAARRRAGPPALGTAIFVLLLWDPWLSRSFGFALSALATAGLLLFARPVGDAIAKRLPGRARPLGDAIAIPIAAQAMCGPVIVLLQNSVSLVGVPANVVAAPFVAPATLAGVVAACLAPIAPWLARWTAWAAALPAWGIAETAHVAARVPAGSLPWVPGATGALLLAVLTLALVCCGPWIVQAVRRHPLVSVLVALGSTALWWPIAVRPVADSWVYAACDVGQGDGGVLRTGTGSGVVIDVGPDDERIDECLRRFAITRIDCIVLTHFHADHVGGLAGALRGRKVGAIIVTPVVEGSAGATKGDASGDAPLVLRLAGAHGIPLRTVHQGDVLRWGAATATVLWPTYRVLHDGSVQNNASITLAVRAEGLRLLLTGDIEREAAAAIRRYLASEPPGERTFDVLKVAHHGSANQDGDLVRSIHAPVALVSVGADNDYGHPAPRTLDLLRDAGSAVYRTDRGGTVIVVERAGRPWISR